ncbi:hypothetical protein RIF29_24245 [Crotalaria pallida]|uniref:Uncharacterized protein n=1 Tax=Crotalaria pallida TaxID=3830 RepID=A0AAN9ERL4_CROPI
MPLPTSKRVRHGVPRVECQRSEYAIIIRRYEQRMKMIAHLIRGVIDGGQFFRESDRERLQLILTLAEAPIWKDIPEDYMEG